MALWPTKNLDAVVCATGFYPPRFHATRDALSIIMAVPVNDDHSLNAPRVTADLRVTLEGAGVPKTFGLSACPHICALRLSALFIKELNRPMRLRRLARAK